MPLSYWILFHIGIILAICADLWLLSGNGKKENTMRNAILSTIGWVVLAALFNVWLYYIKGQEAALAFLSGYLLEKALSVDNLFVFLLIFSYFNVPPKAQKKTLLYGVLGAIIMRAVLILAGIAMVEYFSWVFYLFGLFLIFTGVHLAFQQESEIALESSWGYRFFSSFVPFTNQYYGNSFFIKEQGKLIATPLFMVIVLIEATDFIFALDSVPAILGITLDPFIVYTSNIFAILGLRSLFFVLEKSLERFHLLHYALALILVFIGFKMLLKDFYHIPIGNVLLIISGILTISIIGSLWVPAKKPKNEKFKPPKQETQ